MKTTDNRIEKFEEDFYADVNTMFIKSSNYVEVPKEYNFNTEFPTWIIAYCQDSDSWFVTNKRFFVCGETISGRMFTRYDTDCWMLDEIKSIHLEHQNIVIKTSKDKLKLKGENFDRLVFKLQKHAP